MRLVSLLTSATEIVVVHGLADDLVGVSNESDHPAGTGERAAVVVGGLDTAGLTPGQIDAAVRARVTAGEDLHTLQAGTVADLVPDLVVTQDLCQVCALPAGAVTEALAHLGTTADVLTLDPHTLDDVLATITPVGERRACRASWSGSDRGWSRASRRSPPSCTPAQWPSGAVARVSD